MLLANGSNAFEHDGDDAREDEDEERDVERLAAGCVRFEDDLVESGRVLSVSLPDFRRQRLVALATQRKGVACVTKEKGDRQVASGGKGAKKVCYLEAESQGSVADSGRAVVIGGGCSEGGWG